MNLEISSTLYVNLKEVRLNLLYLVYCSRKTRKLSSIVHLSLGCGHL